MLSLLFFFSTSLYSRLPGYSRTSETFARHIVDMIQPLENWENPSENAVL